MKIAGKEYEEIIIMTEDDKEVIAVISDDDEVIVKNGYEVKLVAVQKN